MRDGVVIRFYELMSVLCVGFALGSVWNFCEGKAHASIIVVFAAEAVCFWMAAHERRRRMAITSEIARLSRSG